MADCCAESACEIDKLRDRQRGTLLVVLWINVAFFCIEGAAGTLAASTALLGDALDMLGDALVYAFSLYVVSRGALWQTRAATLKSWIMLAFGAAVLGQAAYKLWVPEVPHYPIMSVIGAAALVANVCCLALLWRHRDDDINMRSVWLCSRNDVIANVSVLGSAAAVWITRSQVPDLIVGVAISALFVRSALRVLADAHAERASLAASSNAIGDRAALVSRAARTLL